MQGSDTTVSSDDYSISPTLAYSADCDPSECKTLTFDLTVADQCDDYQNETLVLGFTSLSTGLCAGDADGGVVDGVTYSETFVTFTLDIWNDECM